VKNPTEDSQDSLTGRNAESLIEGLRQKLPDDLEKEVWLEQLFALLRVSEDDHSPLYEDLDKNAKLRLKVAQSDLRKMLVQVVWGFTCDDSMTLDDLAREITNLTALVLGRMDYPDPDSIYKDHRKALSSFVSLEDATNVLSNSKKVKVVNVSIGTFIPEDEVSATMSKTSTSAIEE
jgi:hypothetical protein